jgi:hypothetical protein
VCMQLIVILSKSYCDLSSNSPKTHIPHDGYGGVWLVWSVVNVWCGVCGRVCGVV